MAGSHNKITKHIVFPGVLVEQLEKKSEQVWTQFCRISTSFNGK